MHSRSFAMSDLATLPALLAAWGGGTDPYYLHVGDFLWGAFQNDVTDPARRIRVWTDDAGRVMGFGFRYGPGWTVLQPASERRRDKALLRDMIAWGEGDLKLALVEEGKAEGVLRVSAIESDGWSTDFLCGEGFGFDPATGRAILYHQRELALPPEAAVPPPGFVVRDMSGEADLDRRVELHREVWHPSKITLSGYRRMRSLPGYDPALDLVLVAPDGRFAAYCIVWWDGRNHVGEFEPVGTAAAFRRQGLARVVIQEGLSRLSQRGAKMAVVGAEVGNPASRALYASCGFAVRDTYCWWTRPVAVGPEVGIDRGAAVA